MNLLHVNIFHDVLDLRECVGVGAKDSLDPAGFFEQFAHGPGHCSHVSLGLAQVVKLLGQVVTDLDLDICASQVAIISRQIREKWNSYNLKFPATLKREKTLVT